MQSNTYLNSHYANVLVNLLERVGFPLRQTGILNRNNNIDVQKLNELKQNPSLTKPYQSQVENLLINRFRDENNGANFTSLEEVLFNFISYIEKDNWDYLTKNYGLVSERFVQFLRENDSNNANNRNSNIENLLRYPDYATKLFKDEQLNTLYRLNETLDASSDADLSKLMSVLSQDAQRAKKLAEELASLSIIELSASGAARDSWSEITKRLVGRAPEIKSRQDSTPLINEILNNKKIPEITPFNFNEKVRAGWKFLRPLGRTLLLQNSVGDILAVKVQKSTEPPAELIKEYKTTQYINEQSQKLNLEGKVPTPQSLNTMSAKNLADFLRNIPPESLRRFYQMIGTKNEYVAYVYKVDKDHTDYFTYLHDTHLSDAEFNKANRVAVGNLFKLLAQQLVFPQLADMFHNGTRRYKVHANLLGEIFGSGRLEKWPGAVAYPNVRGPNSGLADYGDNAALSDFMANGRMTNKFYKDLENRYQGKVGNYLMANIIAEYQFVFFLIAGHRGAELTENAKRQGKSAEEIKAIWQKLAEQLVDNSALTISLLTGKSEQLAKQSLLPIINIDHLARQMQFWMTNEHAAYLRYSQLPNDLYPKETRVSLPNSLQGLSDRLGYSDDGINPDLGPKNGQNPIKEADKLLYWTNNIIFGAYHEFRLTLNDIQKISKAKDPLEVEALRQSSFKHLPPKQFHRAQMEVLKTELQDKNLPPRFAQELKNDFTEHQRNYAAATIQTFWRNKKFQSDNLATHNNSETLGLKQNPGMRR